MLLLPLQQLPLADRKVSAWRLWTVKVSSVLSLSTDHCCLGHSKVRSYERAFAPLRIKIFHNSIFCRQGFASFTWTYYSLSFCLEILAFFVPVYYSIPCYINNFNDNGSSSLFIFNFIFDSCVFTFHSLHSKRFYMHRKRKLNWKCNLLCSVQHAQVTWPLQSVLYYYPP